MEIAMHGAREKEHIWFCKKRPIQLKEMLMHTKVLKFEDLGVFKNTSKRLNCNTDKKRIWEREYKNFGDFLDSEPQKSQPLVFPLEKVTTKRK